MSPSSWRGILAADIMQKMGYTNVVNLIGGYNSAWKEANSETFAHRLKMD